MLPEEEVSENASAKISCVDCASQTIEITDGQYVISGLIKQNYNLEFTDVDDSGIGYYYSVQFQVIISGKGTWLKER